MEGGWESSIWTPQPASPRQAFRGEENGMISWLIVRPHPDPLPRGEGTASGPWRTCSRCGFNQPVLVVRSGD